jgi:hypothetical protein
MTNAPIFQSIFAESWSRLPPVFLKHYANRAFTRDCVTVEGRMFVETSLLIRLLGPFLRLAGALVPQAGSDIPVTVSFRSEPDSQAFCLEREFRFPARHAYHFRSRMVPNGENEVIEWMRVGIGWRASYSFVNGRIVLAHRGYVFNVFGWMMPLPLEALLGVGHASETALDDERFEMAMEIRHKFFGRVYAYGGIFCIREVNLDG